MANESDALYDAAWKGRCAALNVALVTLRYHRRRQRFFDLLDKSTKAATVILGASLLGQQMKTVLPLVASAISCLGLMALVFGYGDRKQAHKELAEQAALLAAKVEELPVAQLDDAAVRGWQAELSRLNAKEPPALRTLVEICEWEEACREGHKNHVPRPFWFRRLVADFF